MVRYNKKNTSKINLLYNNIGQIQQKMRVKYNNICRIQQKKHNIAVDVPFFLVGHLSNHAYQVNIMVIQVNMNNI